MFFIICNFTVIQKVHGSLAIKKAFAGQDISLVCYDSTTDDGTISNVTTTWDITNGEKVSKIDTEILHLTSISLDDQGTYTCRMTNSSANIILKDYELFIYKDPELNI